MTKLWVKFKYNATQVSTKECQNVDDFIEAIMKQLSPHFDSVQLSLSTTDGGPFLCPGLLLTDIPSQPGYSENSYMNPLFISVIPFENPGSRSLSEPILKDPHPKRKERWEKLNEIIEKNKNKLKSSVRWGHIKYVLEPTRYVQSSKPIPEIQFNILSQYLSFTLKCFGPITFCNQSQRLHLITPIIICVCFLFNGEVEIEEDKDLFGDFLKAHSHLEFVLRRGNKTVCIYQAKKGNIREGMAQDLIGCEIVAEMDQLNSVYGIVTDYVSWNFLRSLDEKIELEECVLSIGTNGPVEASLLRITGKIYAMLSDE